MNVIFLGPKGHFVMNKYLYLLNMESIYHIITIRVNETSRAHVWRLLPSISERDMTSGIRAVLTVGHQPS
jgi:hypothetical protein